MEGIDRRELGKRRERERRRTKEEGNGLKTEEEDGWVRERGGR